MITLQDGIKYIGLAAIIYFLIKAFAANILSDKHILILVILIMAVVIFIANQKVGCDRRIEGFQQQIDGITKQPDTPQGASNSSNDWNKQNYNSQDFEDIKNLMNLDIGTYNRLNEQEKQAINKIKSKYRDDMVYTQTNPLNTVPLGSQLYGYTYMPPENWFRAYERPPVCITDKKCQVCPVADASIAGLLEFDSNTNTLGTMNINTDYINRVLNNKNNMQPNSTHGQQQYNEYDSNYQGNGYDNN